MGKRGPAKQPQQLLELKGTARKGRERPKGIQGQKIKALIQVYGLVDYNVLSERGKCIFRQRCIFLIGLNLLEASYLDALLLYAQYYDEALTCIEQIKNSPTWFTPVHNMAGEVAGFVELPYLKRLDRLLPLINTLGTQFGFTPASRARLQVEVEQDKKRDIMDVTEDVIEI